MLILNAEDCEIRSLTNKEELAFLNELGVKHITISLVSYGLFYKEELVQLMSFSKPRYNKDYQWELIYEYTKQGFFIEGGTNKLWSEFIKCNNVRSCVYYYYPQDELKEFDPKYIECCGFKNIKRAKPEKKIYFEGVWSGEIKKFKKSVLEKHGVDRLLKGNFGHDRTNEQILLDLGFEKKYEDGFSPQVDSYFPFGVVFRVDDLDSGRFYIGETTDKNNWENGYMGSGSSKWQNHLNKHPDIEKFPNNPDSHHYKRTLIASNFNTPKDLFEREIIEIRKYCVEENGKWKVNNPLCMNYKTTAQSDSYIAKKSNIICPECGGKRNLHYKTCSKYKHTPCPECGVTSGPHKKTCSRYKQTEICPECGGRMNHHKKTCSQYNDIAPCSECGCVKSHKKTCSHYKEADACPECGRIRSHAPECSNYKAPKVCPECGVAKGHKADCSRNPKKGNCPECGNSLISNTHKNWCSHYKKKTKPKPCPECGSVFTHKSTCSKSRGFCEECGVSLVSPHHKPGCSKYKPSKVCDECGGKNGRHYKTCSQYKKPKDSKICEECGCSHGKHLNTCSHSKGKCPHCGNSLQSNHHKPDCPLNKINL